MGEKRANDCPPGRQSGETFSKMCFYEAADSRQEEVLKVTPSFYGQEGWVWCGGVQAVKEE